MIELKGLEKERVKGPEGEADLLCSPTVTESDVSLRRERDRGVKWTDRDFLDFPKGQLETVDVVHE